MIHVFLEWWWKYRQEGETDRQAKNKPKQTQYIYGLGQPLVSTQAGWWRDWEQPCQEGLGGTGVWKAGHDPSVCARSPEGQQYPGLHHQQRGQQGEGRDSAPPAPLWWDPTWSPASSCGVLSTGRTWTCWSGSRGGPQKFSEGWSTSPMRTGRESWGCSAWRTEGSRESL